MRLNPWQDSAHSPDPPPLKRFPLPLSLFLVHLSPMSTGYEVLVIGGGAAGMMAAIEAGKRGRSVLVIERAEKIGKKILISGGGRCNFTNINARPENYLCSNPHFPRSALARYTPSDFIALVERHQVPYHEKKLGQLFCDDTSRRIVTLLTDEAAAAGVEILTGEEITEVTKTETGFQVATEQKSWSCESLVIAAGGLSIPKMGATDFAHRIARQFGLHLIPVHPGLVPFTLSGEELHRLQGLSGVSMDVEVSTSETSFRENLLITHRGLSGPVILQISSYWQPGKPIRINLFPDLSDEALHQSLRSGMKTSNWLAQYLPRRFVDAWIPSDLADQVTAQLSRSETEKLVGSLRSWEIRPAGTEGFAKAEVTIGGVNTDEISSKTFETRKVPGLFIIGEALDVTGWLGGYNFQWAWASGWAAGQYA